MPTTSETHGILIIGGGVIGLSLAYHLTRRGVDDVLVLERNQLTSGTSWHAAGIVGPLRATPNMTRLAMFAGELFPRLEQETGAATGYRKTGGYWLARVPERMDELNRIAALGRHFKLSPELITPGDLGKAMPVIKADSLHGVMSVAEDATVNPVDLCMAYARGARHGGVKIREGLAVDRILTSGNRAVGVVLDDGSEIRSDQVAICCGAWSKQLAATAGLALPMQAVEHMYVVTEPRDEFGDFPVVRDLDRGIYIKGDTGKLIIGGFEPNAKCWDPQGPEGARPFLELRDDWEQFTPFMEAALDLVPMLETTGIQHFMNGPESFTADTRPLVGQSTDVDGLFVAAGLNSVGVMSSAGIGRALADWMVDEKPSMDLWEVDVARADPLTAIESHMTVRMEEAVADQFALHWPYKQPKAGRNLRRSALHEQWADQGAEFGVTAGWERSLWYAQNDAEHALPYSVHAQAWWPMAEREAAYMQAGTVLIDLSPFTKVAVSGIDALGELNGLCTAQLDVAAGRTVYTQFLNAQGGIELDATVTRVSRDEFEITSGAATRWRDLAYLRRHLTGAQLKDLTERYCVIGVMGNGSRKTMRAVAADWNERPFGQCCEIEIAGIACRATRLSFVGELGWEISVPVANAPTVFDALIETKARPMGHYAVDGCRLEKGFKHWGHDIGPDVTPLEAGLAFTIDWSKEFIGRSALEAQRGNLDRRLVLFDIEGEPLALHDEPVWEAGRIVGLTTSGARGPRTGLTLAFAMIEVATLPMVERKFEIEIAGRRYPAGALTRPPFDPKSERMRA